MLVAGGAGAVGNAAIQLARWSGATVVTTVSSDEKAALARAAGAHHVVNYREGDATAEIRAIAPDGVDIAVEVAPAQNIGIDLDVVKVHGLVSIYANNGGDELTMPLRAAFGKNLRFQFLILYTLHDHLVQAAVEDVNAAVAAGALRVGPGRRHAAAPLPARARPRPRRTRSRTGRSARSWSTSRTRMRDRQATSGCAWLS